MLVSCDKQLIWEVIIDESNKSNNQNQRTKR